MDREGAILSEMLEIVEQRDSLRNMLEEDRQRWALFLNLIDAAQSSVEDGSFARDDSPVQQQPVEPFEEQLASELAQNSDSDQFVDSEEEFNHLVFDDDDDSIQITDSLNELFEVEHVPGSDVFKPAIETFKNEERAPTKETEDLQQELSNQTDQALDDNFESGFLDEENDDVDQVEHAQREKSLEKSSSIDFDVSDEDVEEFERLVQDLSDHSVSSLESGRERKPEIPEFVLTVECEGVEVEPERPPSPLEQIVEQKRKIEDRPISSTSETSELYYQMGKIVDSKSNSPKASPTLQRKVQVFDEMERTSRRYSPFKGEFEGRTIELSDLVSEQELDIYYDYNSPDEEQSPSSGPMRRRSHIVQSKIETFDTLDRKARKYSLQVGRDEKDWGSLGVKFKNRGAVRDLVWQFEFNQWQATGCQGNLPDYEWKEKRRATLTPSTQESECESDEPKTRQRRKSRQEAAEVKPELVEREATQSSESSGTPAWQIAVVIWLVIFCFFMLSWHLF